jgi:diguanylate cyclase (GGDEF)-like protein/PAS domain S-box-containing protein
MGDSLRVVILEDNDHDLELMQRQLRAGDVEVGDIVVARDRQQFLAALQTGPNLVLSDFALPDYEAEAALREVQQHDPDCAFIVVSGAVGDETAVELMKEGADDYVLKDRLVGLPTAIRHAIERRQAQIAQRQAERSLRESEQQYRRIVETSLEGIWLLDANGAITFANQRMWEMLDCDDTGMVGQSVLHFVHAGDEPSVRQWFNRQTNEGCQLDLRLCDRQGHVIWTNCSLRQTFDKFGQFTGGLLMATDISARKEAEEALRSAAAYDSLTGLVNRSVFLDRLEHAVSQCRHSEAKTCAVLFIDVDRFKEINDTLGHAYGDQLLTTIADRLKESITPNEHPNRRVTDEAVVGRTGGDEFTALLTEIADEADATAAARRMQAAISQPIYLHGREIRTTVSIGVAVRTAEHRSAEQLLRDADTALYRAKEDGNGRYAVWDQQMQQAARRRFELGQQIDRALEANELTIHYQPIVALDTGQPVGCEALLRWCQARRGVVSPGEFIPLAEETGAIVPIGYWLIEQACHQVNAWNAALEEDQTLYISVNISPRQLLDREFADRVQAILQKTNTPPHWIKFEITESALVDNGSGAGEVLQQIVDLGIHLFMDDFGTGYSSLSHLYELPIDVIKIDRSFTMAIDANEKQRSIVRSIIGLAHSIGIPPVAEGIENADHVWRLLNKSCNYGQGFYYSPPLDAAAAWTWLQQRLLAPAQDQDSAA